MDEQRRPAWPRDNMASSGFVVLGIGVLVGVLAMTAVWTSTDVAVDVQAMGAYSAIFVIVGVSMVLQGD